LDAPDIFLSYNREDAARAKHFADAFAAEGIDVWWDVALRSGEAYDQVTEEALHNAKAVVVLWSPRSVVSRWVRAEATIADRNKVLMPVMIEPCRRPVMFELTQTAELAHWQGNGADPVWQSFLRDVRARVGGKATVPAMAQVVPAGARVGGAKPSIVVLPFSNMGGDPEQEYFAEGITEDIITDLSKVSALAVISRNTAFTFKGKAIDVRAVSQQLGVSHVLEGSVRRAGNRVRITAQLIDGSSDEHVWADRFDRNLDDIFELQDEISKAIVAALKVSLMPREEKAIEERGTTSLEAYDLYMRARAIKGSARTAEHFLEAERLFRETLAIDPGFSPALSGIAHVYLMLIIFLPEKRAEAIRNFNELCGRAVARAPGHWGTQVLLASRMLFERTWFEAIDGFEQAMAAAPSFDAEVAVNYATCLMNVGRVNDAIKVLQVARVSDPYSANVSVYLQMALFEGDRLDACRAEDERTNHLAGYGNREEAEHTALYQAWEEDDPEAIKDQFRRFLDAQEIPSPYMAEYLAVIDQPEAVKEILRKAFGDPVNQDGSRMSLMIGHLMHNGLPDLAMAAARRGLLELGFPATFLIWWPPLKELRRTKEAKQLIRDLGICRYWRRSGNWGEFARPAGDDDFEIVA